MNMKLSKEDLQKLVFGSSPYYSAIETLSKKGYGNWIGGFVDKWDWDYNTIKSLSEEELYNIYKICKESWDKANEKT